MDKKPKKVDRPVLKFRRLVAGDIIEVDVKSDQLVEHNDTVYVAGVNWEGDGWKQVRDHWNSSDHYNSSGRLVGNSYFVEGFHRAKVQLFRSTWMGIG